MADVDVLEFKVNGLNFVDMMARISQGRWRRRLKLPLLGGGREFGEFAIGPDKVVAFRLQLLPQQVEEELLESLWFQSSRIVV